MKIKKLSDKAILPTRGTKASAGLDLYSAKSTVIGPRDIQRIPTDIAVEIPEGYYGMVVGRSGATLKGIHVITGIVDSDYRGNIGLIVKNDTQTNKVICEGDRIAQIIIQPYLDVELQEGELDDTERGSNGFGSTGM